MVELLAVILILAILLRCSCRRSTGRCGRPRTRRSGPRSTSLPRPWRRSRPSTAIIRPAGSTWRRTATSACGHVTRDRAPGDITYAQLAQRSLAALRKFFPRVVLQHLRPVFCDPRGQQWYDFNGNGRFDPNPYILQGHECLVFFLGGIPQPTALGLRHDRLRQGPDEPVHRTAIVGNAMYSGNRQPPLFEFAANRLVARPEPDRPDANPTAWNRQVFVPGYLDSLGNSLGRRPDQFLRLLQRLRQRRATTPTT